jgi:DNA-directed RNA polymerase subunit H (RpoH/RPB5)
MPVDTILSCPDLSVDQNYEEKHTNLHERNKAIAMKLTIMPVEDLPLIHAGDNLPALIAERCVLKDGDIVTIASSVYSKAKGHTRKLADITPTPGAAHKQDDRRRSPVSPVDP